MIELIPTFIINENGKLKVEEEVFTRIYAVMSKIDEENNNLPYDQRVFAGKKDRLDFAHYSFLITYNGIDIGFLYATVEGRYNNALFLDMAIIKEYRGKGIAKYALHLFLSNINEDERFIIGETKPNNQGAISLAEDLGIKIHENDFNYYLFPKSRYNDFIEFNNDGRFERAMAKDYKIKLRS